MLHTHLFLALGSLQHVVSALVAPGAEVDQPQLAGGHEAELHAEGGLHGARAVGRRAAVVEDEEQDGEHGLVGQLGPALQA